MKARTVRTRRPRAQRGPDRVVCLTGDGEPTARATCVRFACRARPNHDGLCERHAAQAEMQRQLRER